MSFRNLALTLTIPVALTGCAGMSEGQRGVAIGAGLGTLIGAGASSAMTKGDGKATRRGAVAGAAVGALGGYIWSTRMQKQREDMEAATAGTGVQVSQTEDNRLKLDVPSDISFDVSKAAIKSNFQPILDQFAHTLNQHTNTRIDIIGHTDSTGSDAINDPLSVNRAASTRSYLASRGVDSQRIAISGHGARQPVANNATNAGRAQNRRVEIFIAEPAAQ